MKYARILMIPALRAAMALPAAAQKLSLSEIFSYLNDLRTAQGQFTQVDEDGTVSTGRILLKRPGWVRFEYDPPEAALVVADGASVGIIDPRSNERQGFTLHRTPLKIILARNVDLTRERMVVGHASDGVTTTVRAQDPKNPEYGSIDLLFTADPGELRQWVINDANGGGTTVILGDVRRDVRLDDDNFVIPGTQDHRIDRRARARSTGGLIWSLEWMPHAIARTIPPAISPCCDGVPSMSFGKTLPGDRSSSSAQGDS